MQTSATVTGGFKTAFTVILFYGIIGVLASVLLVFGVSLLAHAEVFSLESSGTFVAAAAFVGALISGLCATGKLRRPLIYGTLQGVSNFIILYLAGTLVFMRIIAIHISTSLLLACIIGGLVGGLLSAMSHNKK